MGLIAYCNGITEDYKPSGLVFTKEELVNIFSEYKEIKTSRVEYLLNTWCIYGNSDNIIKDPMEYNKIGSEIIKEHVYSPCLFIHDSEIDPDWNATDSVLYKDYSYFIAAIKNLVNEVANSIMNSYKDENEEEGKSKYLPQLITVGITPDKKVIYGLNPNEQTDEFFENENFYIFSQKVYNFISTNKQNQEPFTIFEDKNAKIVIETVYVKQFLTIILEKFKSKEDYEICTHIDKIIKSWDKLSNPLPKKRRKTKLSKSSDEQ